jgi:hypothetical protein
MTASLSNHEPFARPADDFDGTPPDEDNPFEERLRGLSHQQLADRLRWLSWYQPGAFTAVMDYMEFCDNRAAGTDTDPSLAAFDLDEFDEDPAPVCAPCGAAIGVFVKFGLDWRHYRGDAALGEAEIFAPGHLPELAWRISGPSTAVL